MAGVDDKLKYEQLSNDFRSLNVVLWQTPLIVMSLTGGLWFAVASFDLTPQGRSGLLGFAAIANLLMIAALYRLRWVMHRIQAQIVSLDGREIIGPNFTIVNLFSLLLLIAAVASLTASCSPSDYFGNNANKVIEVKLQ